MDDDLKKMLDDLEISAPTTEVIETCIIVYSVTEHSALERFDTSSYQDQYRDLIRLYLRDVLHANQVGSHPSTYSLNTEGSCEYILNEIVSHCQERLNDLNDPHHVLLFDMLAEITVTDSDGNVATRSNK